MSVYDSGSSLQTCPAARDTGKRSCLQDVGRHSGCLGLDINMVPGCPSLIARAAISRSKFSICSIWVALSRKADGDLLFDSVTVCLFPHHWSVNTWAVDRTKISEVERKDLRIFWDIPNKATWNPLAQPWEGTSGLDGCPGWLWVKTNGTILVGRCILVVGFGCSLGANRFGFWILTHGYVFGAFFPARMRHHRRSLGSSPCHHVVVGPKPKVPVCGCGYHVHCCLFRRRSGCSQA